MEIKDIKQQLPLARVLQHYGLKPDKNLRLHCPFHDDKTPSMQVYYKTQTCYCFSSNCKTHGKSMDVIDFVMYKENTDKHNALLKCAEIINYFEGKLQRSVNPASSGAQHQIKPAAAPAGSKEQGEALPMPLQNQLNRSQFLQNMFTYFKNAVHNSKPAQEYIQSRQLDFKKTEVGYNAGQFHHGARKEQVLINQCIQYGLLLDLGMKARTGETAYKPFGKWCICFALRNKTGEIVGLYFRSTLQGKEQRHFYLRDRQGLYPGYPKAATTKLILTESIIDAATLLEQEPIKNSYEVLALFGTNGLTEEHQTAIKQLQQLEEIIFFLNGDEPGQKATEKYAPMLKAGYPNLKITSVAVPQHEDVNSLLQGHSPEILTHLVETRKDFDFIFSNENPTEKEKQETKLFIETVQAEPINHTATEEPTAGLNTNNPYNLQYQGSEAMYQIKGFRTDQLDSLKITLQITAQ